MKRSWLDASNLCLLAVAVGVAGCGSSRQASDGGNDAGRSDGGTFQLTGPNGFEVQGWWFTPNYPAATCGTPSDVLADGGIAAFGLTLYSVNATSAVCANDFNDLSGMAVVVTLGTSQFIEANLGSDSGPPITAGLTPGTYNLDNEGIPDQDLCSISPGFSAVLTEFAFPTDGGGAVPLYNGVGSISLSAVSANSVSGSVDAWLVAVDGSPNVDGGPLTGNFQAAGCP
jgi:hypothetical protein